MQGRIQKSDVEISANGLAIFHLGSWKKISAVRGVTSVEVLLGWWSQG
jgi:hypothetical protein